MLLYWAKPKAKLQNLVVLFTCLIEVITLSQNSFLSEPCFQLMANRFGVYVVHLNVGIRLCRYRRITIVSDSDEFSLDSGYSVKAVVSNVYIALEILEILT